MLGFHRKSCPDPMGEEGPHAHWSFHTKRVIIFWTLWWDYDRRNFDCPIEFNIHTEKKYYLFRPFSKAQGWDWENNHALDYKEDKNWKHLVSFPQKPSIWEILNDSEEDRRKHDSKTDTD